MTFQDVRGYFEKACYSALMTAGVPAADISFDNYGETAAPADRPYAVVALSFGNSVEDTLSCEGLENLRGSLQVNVYTPKQKGSKSGEEIALAVLKAWNTINRHGTSHAPLIRATCRDINGPTTIAPDQRPHHVNVVSCAFSARAA
jgi:hypothetical protein